MSINTPSDWNTIELKAQLAEAGVVESFKVPPPTIEQQLAWATTRCAELQARLHRLKGKAMECQMWIQAGDSARATQAVNAIIIES